MKFILTSLCILLFSCIDYPEENMINNNISDKGSQKIGNNIYLKQVNINRNGRGTDRVYLLTDSTNHLISNLTSTNYEVRVGKIVTTKSVSIISR